MATDAAAEDFVTIVPVGEGRPSIRDPSFVTVLTVGAATGAAEVTVRRPRGERLGLGLKFEGGSAAAEKVRRLLVQSCAENSPAANAAAPWGKLIPGDEILAIDGESVSNLTRIDCVRRLKDSDETLTLLVRHFEQENKIERNNMDVTDSVPNTKQSSDIVRPTTLPPPVPPRKLGKKNSFKDKPTLLPVGEQNNNGDGQIDCLLNGKHNGISTITKLSRKSSFDSHIHRQAKEGIAYLKKGSPEEVRRLVRRLSDGKAMPPEAEVYIDLLSTEWERCLVLADAESDDTGSSISTVVDRLGSMASSVENSIPSTPTMQPKTIDIQKVLNCIENIDTNILKDMTSKTFLEKQIEMNTELKLIDKTTNGFNGHDNSTQNSFLTEEVITTSKKILQNDKNNNNTVISNTGDATQQTQAKKVENKVENVAEKPKPMPRNTKIERSASEKKPRPTPVPEIPPPPVPDSLLTPTKKNCIETWLQRSEAEMNNKTVEKLEDTTVPEILPRLIDFVPKHQFKENSSEAPLTRPTTAPPPPPTETREDGSGASLDTIGELDESADVTDNGKPVDTIKKKERKSSFERSFWEDRVNKSDAEDKSLSNDETPLPSCPRQPPDGVETPCDAVEKAPEPASRLPPRLPAGWPGARPRFSYTSRTQDARSEASVKDKIAMFSNDRATSSDRLDKCGTLPNRNSSTVRKSTAPYANSYSDVSSLDRRLTKSQDNLDELPRTFKRHTERPEVLGGVERASTTSNYSSAKSSNASLYTDSKPLFYGSTTTLPSTPDPAFAKNIYHVRSVSDDNGNKNISTHKSNLEYLIEQRKKSMSKLRGLVIPEVQTPIVDLPEIKVQDPISKSFLLKSNQSGTNTKANKTNHAKPLNLNDAKWNADLLPNNLPKYSPAFKRKSLQVYTPSSLSKESTPEPNYNERIDLLNKMNYKSSGVKAHNTLNNGLISRLSTNNIGTTKPLTNEVTNSSRKEHKDILNYIRDYKNMDIKICTATDVVDSDNDSAMSSTQSSYRSSASSPMHNIENIESDSSRLSPRGSHYATYSIFKSEVPNKANVTEKNPEEYIKRNVCRSVSSDTNVSLSSSAGSAATSGSQASCSSLESSVADSDKRKVSKSYNIDTINRRNILASAKCRSGRDAKLKSPVVETKFSHESCDRSPSPVHKTSERLSTLTPSVSVVSNKGENRRRNKVIAETDSDSDSDANLWQRKNDFKNTRLKRNSSSATKNKQNDISLESPKMEDGPKIISEKIIKEINKAGLDNYNNNNRTANLSQKNDIAVKKTDIILSNKLEKINKPDVNEYHKTIDIVDGSGANKQTREKPLVINKKIENEKPNEKLNNSPAEEVKVSTQSIRLMRGAGTGVGVILAGGIDCEAKDVTVHRVLADSVAAKAGLKRGAKVRSINGCAMAGLTHAQSVTILKEQRSEVIIEIEIENRQNANGAGCGSDKAESKVRHEAGDVKNMKDDNKASGSVVTVLLEKAGGGAGLGFGLDGGRDSPRGDRPLTIKKLFAGGAAAQSGRVLVGAELLSAGGQSMEGFTRTQAWAALKALPAGPVTLVLRNPKGNIEM
ncbi:PDZ domain-containing protein big bang [Anticarsia gemmatalis]|uniref:PDZ domain-containing protein big bang n=1 Tax=Anticarsia gemmatalis TaxID=129554 RepID=UPI003F764E91